MRILWVRSLGRLIIGGLRILLIGRFLWKYVHRQVQRLDGSAKVDESAQIFPGFTGQSWVVSDAEFHNTT